MQKTQGAPITVRKITYSVDHNISQLVMLTIDYMQHHDPSSITGTKHTP